MIVGLDRGMASYRQKNYDSTFLPSAPSFPKKTLFFGRFLGFAFLCLPRATCRWSTGEWYWQWNNRGTRRRTRPSATLFTTNSTWTDLG